MLTRNKIVRLIGISLILMFALTSRMFSSDNVVHAQPNFSNPIQVYYNDFDGEAIAAPEVTATLAGITSTEPVQDYDAYGFGGDFLRNDTGGYASGGDMGTPGLTTTLTLTGLPPHTSIDINFLLAIIDSWDGGGPEGCCHPDILTVTVDGNTIFSESFGYINPSFVPTSGVLLALDTPLGFNPEFGDSAYNMGLNPAFDNIPHSASTLTIEWFARGDGWQGDYDESWAIDDVEIIIDANIQLDIDIKPDGYPNSINCQNEKEVITVAVLTTEDFDTLSIDHATVTFEGASEIHVDKKTGEPHRHMEDVDLDGDMDLVFHFYLGDTTLNCGSETGTLIGETYDGIPLWGIDSVRMVNPGACGATPDSAGLSCQDIRDRCPGSESGEKWIEPDGMTAILAYCYMDEEGNGWTLIYNRNNAYFSPDQMYSELPAQGPDFSSNSTSWFIPNDATRWRWDVSVDSGASYRTLETSIPPEARSTTHATVENAPISAVYENTTGAIGPFYFQTIVFSDKCLFGCDSGQASWWGIVNVSQGAGDQDNPGFGGHTDSCNMDSMLLPGDNYTWGDGDLEYYLSDWKDIGGDGIGGTNCWPWYPTTQYRYRFWAR